jgi:hypothetical protein
MTCPSPCCSRQSLLPSFISHRTCQTALTHHGFANLYTVDVPDPSREGAIHHTSHGFEPHLDLIQEALLAQYRDKPLSSIRTPAVIIDVTTFKKNAQTMKDRTKAAGALFRCVLSVSLELFMSDVQLYTVHTLRVTRQWRVPRSSSRRILLVMLLSAPRSLKHGASSTRDWLIAASLKT